ncbi:MAG: hypothetical protein KDN20_16240 [Verrucomicrobiae bacterium]|nr:hypothetical protein [Verrucomicrobiae bacterium]
MNHKILGLLAAILIAAIAPTHANALDYNKAIDSFGAIFKYGASVEEGQTVSHYRNQIISSLRREKFDKGSLHRDSSVSFGLGIPEVIEIEFENDEEVDRFWELYEIALDDSYSASYREFDEYFFRKTMAKDAFRTYEECVKALLATLPEPNSEAKRGFFAIVTEEGLEQLLVTLNWIDPAPPRHIFEWLFRRSAPEVINVDIVPRDAVTNPEKVLKGIFESVIEKEKSFGIARAKMETEFEIESAQFSYTRTEMVPNPDYRNLGQKIAEMEARLAQIPGEISQAQENARNHREEQKKHEAIYQMLTELPRSEDRQNKLAHHERVIQVQNNAAGHHDKIVQDRQLERAQHNAKIAELQDLNGREKIRKSVPVTESFKFLVAGHDMAREKNDGTAERLVAKGFTMVFENDHGDSLKIDVDAIWEPVTNGGQPVYFSKQAFEEAQDGAEGFKLTSK